jgi:hypothetical protein
MSFDKGLQLSNSSLLPKDSQSAFGNIQTTAEGDASTYSSSAAYSHPNLQNQLPPPPPLNTSYQHSSYPLQPSEQVYHLHVPQTTFGTTHHLPLQYPWSTTRYDATFAPPTPLFGGYSESRIKAFSESRGTLPGHRYDIGYRAAPTALPLTCGTSSVHIVSRSREFVEISYRRSRGNRSERIKRILKQVVCAVW